MLTWFLRESLAGNSRTTMLATCSPVALNREETLSTLRYAASAKNIKTAAAKNEDPMEAKVRQLAEEIARLKAALEVAEAKGSGEGSDSGDAAGEAAAASSGSGGGDAILDSSSATGEGSSDALKSKSALLPNELDNLSEEERETYLQTKTAVASSSTRACTRALSSGP